MIWTSLTGLATHQVVSSPALPERPTLRTLVADHGLVDGLRRRLDGWRAHPPPGPVAISTTPTSAAAHGREPIS